MAVGLDRSVERIAMNSDLATLHAENERLAAELETCLALVHTCQNRSRDPDDLIKFAKDYINLAAELERVTRDLDQPRSDEAVMAMKEMRAEARAVAAEVALATEREKVARLTNLLLMSAAHCQGGHSAAGGAIADLFGIPFPVRMDGLERAAIARGLDPRELWPWLFEMRAERARVLAETAPADGDADG